MVMRQDTTNETDDANDDLELEDGNVHIVLSVPLGDFDSVLNRITAMMGGSAIKKIGKWAVDP
jgi:hypothetical protein